MGDFFMPFNKIKSKIKSSLYSSYYAEACNELRGPSPRLSAWATQLRRNVATMASRWRRCADLTGPGIEPRTSRTDSVRLATELTAGFLCLLTTFFKKMPFTHSSVLVRLTKRLKFLPRGPKIFPAAMITDVQRLSQMSLFKTEQSYKELVNLFFDKIMQ